MVKPYSMRILILSPHFAEYSLSLALALADEHNVQLVLSEQNAANEIGGISLADLHPRLRVTLLPHRASISLIVANFISYRRIIREFDPDVIHVQEDPKDYLVGALVRCNTPMVLTVHDPRPHLGSDSTSERFSRVRVYRWLLRRMASAVLIHSKLFMAQIHQDCPGALVGIAPHGPLGKLGHVPTSPTPASGRCLFFGRIQEYKGLGDFIKAIRLLKGRGVHAIGVIAGRGPDLARYKSDIEGDPAFELNDRYIDREEVIRLFDKSQVIVLPYLEATQSGVAAYALGRGRPLVATNVGALPEYVDNKSSGFVVPPQSPDKLADAIELILANEAASVYFGERALEIGLEACSWQHMADSSVRLYNALVARAHK